MPSSSGHWFAADSPVEGKGFEPSVPRKAPGGGVVCRRNGVPVMAGSDATHQEELLRSIRNPNPPRTEEIDSQHEVGLV